MQHNVILQIALLFGGNGVIQSRVISDLHQQVVRYDLCIVFRIVAVVLCLKTLKRKLQTIGVILAHVGAP